MRHLSAPSSSLCTATSCANEVRTRIIKPSFDHLLGARSTGFRSINPPTSLRANPISSENRLPHAHAKVAPFRLRSQ